MSYKGWKHNRQIMLIDTSKYGVMIMPEPIYEYPEGHPCRGCPFIFQISTPSCMFGSNPETDDCPNAFYKKIQARQRAEHQSKIKSQEGGNEK